MKKIAVLTALLVIVVFPMMSYAQPAPKDVNVLNDETNPVPVTVQSAQTGYRFIGYSSATTTGNAGGILGMNQICQMEFGPSARICKTLEFYSSPATPTSGFYAWIQPVWGECLPLNPPGSNPSSFNCIEKASGMSFHLSLYFPSSDYALSKYNCLNWSDQSSSYEGMRVVSSTGLIDVQTCQVSQRVACCDL